MENHALNQAVLYREVKLRTNICKISIKKEKKALLSEREINFDILIISWRKGWCWNSEL